MGGKPYWMSPWRKGVRRGQPCIIADVAPSRATRRQGVEIAFALTRENIALSNEQKNQYLSAQLSAALASIGPA